MTPIYLDVETTGFSPKSAAIVEVAAVATDGDKEISHFHSVCNPGERALIGPDAERALAVNGLTREEILEADPIEMVAHDLREWIHAKGAVVMHAYNNAFDSRFLGETPWALNPLSWGECVMRAVANGKKWIKLREAADKYQLRWDGVQHSALADARMAHRVHRAWLKSSGRVMV